jgi:hypothetical protein
MLAKFLVVSVACSMLLTSAVAAPRLVGGKLMIFVTKYSVRDAARLMTCCLSAHSASEKVATCETRHWIITSDWSSTTSSPHSTRAFRRWAFRSSIRSTWVTSPSRPSRNGAICAIYANYGKCRLSRVVSRVTGGHIDASIQSTAINGLSYLTLTALHLVRRLTSC